MVDRIFAAAPLASGTDMQQAMLIELRAAHRLLALALAHMSASGQARFAAASERLGLGLDGATRHHERSTVIAMASGEPAADLQRLKPCRWGHDAEVVCPDCKRRAQGSQQSAEVQHG
ncbi:MAG: hypothetical protein QM750_00205 [Rubrivivax sp.]